MTNGILSNTEDNISFWKTIKSLGLLDKYGAFAENQIVKHDTKSILKAFKSFYSNLAGNLFSKPPKLPNRYTINFVSDYYKKLSLFENLSENWLFKLLKNVEVTKEAGIDQISGRFLKDRARILAKSIIELYKFPWH